MTNKWITSPTVEQVADTPFELSSNVFNPESFIDNFVDQNARWVVIENAVFNQGYVSFNGGVQGWNLQKIACNVLGEIGKAIGKITVKFTLDLTNGSNIPLFAFKNNYTLVAGNFAGYIYNDVLYMQNLTDANNVFPGVTSNSGINRFKFELESVDRFKMSGKLYVDKGSGYVYVCEVANLGHILLIGEYNANGNTRITNVEVESYGLKTTGSDSGFLDNFNTLDTTKWFNSGNVIELGDSLTFPIGTAASWNTSYISLPINSNWNGSKMTLKITSGDTMLIGFGLSSDDAEKVYIYKDTEKHMMLHSVDNMADLNLTKNVQEMTFEFRIENNMIDVYLKTEETYWNALKYWGTLDLTGFADKPVFFRIVQYSSNTVAMILKDFAYLSYPTYETATLPETEAYSVQAPAKLASLDSVLVNRSTLGGGGEARLYMQYKDDEYSEWKSFDGVIGGWSDIGLIDGTELPITNCKPLTNGCVRCKIVFTGNGLVSYPTIDKITYNWSSDVTAPSEPTIATAIATSESILTMLFADLPADAYAIIYEVDINGAGSLPFSTRGKIESGYGYMRFVGSKTEVQKEAEINSLLHSIKGLREGDVVVITAFARDKVGNISAGKQKAITMTGAQYKTMLTKVISESVKTTVVIDSLKEV